MGQVLWLLRVLLTVGGGPSHTTLWWLLSSSLELCPQGSGAYRQAVLLGTQPRTGGFLVGVWDLLGFAF